ncbi:hypothetical protein MLD38_005253 [Melastoma candidum]|uniref:Uncharacterized protein n=1 Tax=Melastoma candidum TaxID=119954 RepID=A0ACB9SA69_9MYRT|nr:hypothetical protein MLD38_005253 [Melastoma candidum]
MDGLEEISGFSLDSQEMSYQRVYDSNNSQKLPIRNAQNSRLRSNQYSENGDDGENMDGKDQILEDEEDHKDETGGDEEYDNEGTLGVDGDNNGKSDSNVVGQGDKYMDDEEDEDDYDDDDEDDLQNVNGGNTDVAERHTKKRKLKSLALSYEFAPRVPPPSTQAVPPPVTRLSSGGRNALADWTERESFILLDAWGERFIQRGKKSLRADEWQEVAAKVSLCEASRPNRSESQCRNRLDTLKKKYKKEKTKLAEMGGSSKWVYFKKMDKLMFSSATEQTGLSCGLDSGEYVFSNPGVYLNQANGMDEMRDSPGSSESSQKAEEEDSDGLPPKKRKSGRDSRLNFRLLACSVKKFSKLYEKIENRRTQEMIELEKMRMQFQRDLEAQRRQIMESAQAEIARIRLGDGKDDLSNDNTNG